MCVTGPLKLKTLEPLKRDLQIFKDALQETGAAEGFFCITAPAWTEEFLWNEYYASDDEMVVALSEQMAPIYKAVTDAGVLLQLDDPAISHDWEEVRRPQMSLAEYERFMMVRVEALNAALAGIPEEMIRYHVCWGSWPGMHTEDIPLEGHRQDDPQGQGAGVLHRGGQVDAPARVEGLARRGEAARGQDPACPAWSTTRPTWWSTRR